MSDCAPVASAAALGRVAYPTPLLPRQFEASRTRIRTSSSATTAASLAFGRIGARSLVTNETSASGSTASGLFGSSEAAGAAAPTSVSMRWALNGGILALRSLVVIDKLPEIRMNGRTRITSRLPTRVTVDTRITLRAALDSLGGGRRALLCRLAGRAVGANAPR